MIEELLSRVSALEVQVRELRYLAGLERPEVDTEEMDNALIAEWQKFGVIAALKEHRRITGSGLKEAKDYIDALRARRPAECERHGW